MATIKQCKMLAARSKQAGIGYDFEAFKDLDNGEVDEKLCEIEEFANKQKPQEQAQVEPKAECLNNVRFGMACKLVIQEAGYLWCLQNTETFCERVEQLYELLNQAEVYVSASLSHSSVSVIDDEGSTLEIIEPDEDYFK